MCVCKCGLLNGLLFYFVKVMFAWTHDSSDVIVSGAVYTRPGN